MYDHRVAPHSLSVDQINGLLSPHGIRCSSCSRIRTGKFNESYFVTLRDGAEMVLRIAPPDDAGFLFYERAMMAQEPTIHRMVHEHTAIPVPTILIYDNSRRCIDRDFLMMTRLAGRPLSQMHLGAPARARILEQCGRLLRQLHENCRDQMYGYLGEHHPMPPAKTWWEAFRVMWSLLLRDIETCGAYSRSDCDRCVAALESHRPAFDRDVPGCLLHMDIWGENILADSAGNITGIIDWDRALWGDKEIEFAVLDYCGISQPPFWNGYGERRDCSHQARIRATFYYLYELQKYIVIRTLRGNDPASAAGYKAEAWKIIEGLGGWKE